MSPSASIPQAYRQPWWGQIDRALKNSFTSAAILGLLVLIAVFVVPKPSTDEVLLEEVPERFAKLILEKPKPPVTTPEPSQQIAKLETPEPVAKPKGRGRKADDSASS